MKFLFPIDGDVLTPADFIQTEDGSCVAVRLLAEGETITVNGKPCRWLDGYYTVTLPITETRTVLTACSPKETQSIQVYRFPQAYGKYRLAIDDIIWTLREIAQNDYDSIYQSEFFAFFRSLYQEFGTKTHFNIYFQDETGFDLIQFPDRYRDEFEKACDWLRITFHAKANLPSHPYREASYETMYNDFHLVTDQIKRFAGDRIWRTSANGLHWAETTRESSRALRDCGSDCQIGYFVFDQDGNPAVSYYLDCEKTEHLSTRDFWVDREESIIFSRDKLILDQVTPTRIVEKLDRLKAENPCGMGTLNFVTHEQYFYPFYHNYLPDYRERVRTAVRWAQENGYEPCFISDCIGPI